MSRRPTPDSWNHHQNVGNGDHPYAVHGSTAVPVIAFDDADREEDCPVCLEPLSFSFRLPGEKPHIVPECGHSLHEACFAAVYGALPRPGTPRKTLGVCGVCRRPMRLGEADTSGLKSNKLALLTGMAERASTTGVSTLYPGRDTPMPRGPGGAGAPSPNGSYQYVPAPSKRSPTDDDAIEVIRSGSSMKSESGSNHNSVSTYIVTPSIQAQAEFPTITRLSPNVDNQSMFTSQSNNGTTQPLTCIVVIQLPARRDNGSLPGGTAPTPIDYSPQSMHPYSPQSNDNLSPPHNGAHMAPGNNPSYPQRTRSPSSSAHSYSQHTTSQHNHTPSVDSDYEQTDPPEPEQEEDDSPFRAITEDLRARIIDWKGHSLSGLGPLQMYDHLHVRRDQLLREFYVYLFREAIICVVEEKKRIFPRLLPDSASNNFNGAPASKGVLRLKGRIFVRHIKHVTDTSLQGELSLTIDMEDDRLESFILIFKDRGSLEAWKGKIQQLVGAERARRAGTEKKKSGQQEANEFGTIPAGVSGKAARMLSGASGGTVTTASTNSRADSYLASGTRNTVSSVTSYGSGFNNNGYGSPSGNGNGAYQPPRKKGSNNAFGGMGMIEEDSSYFEQNDELNLETPTSAGTSQSDSRGMVGYPHSPPQSSPPIHHPHPQQSSLVAPHVTRGPSNGLPSLPHAPLDLLLILSVPPQTAQRSTAQLKLRVMKSTLDFVLASMGPRDRVSIVTFEIGVGGRIRKTPFLRVGGNGDGGLRLAKFVDTMGEMFSPNAQQDPYGGGMMEAGEDDFLAKTNKNEKTDVVTAVNYGLDVVLQRKQRNPVAGILLVSDAADSARRAQMDLVLARAEAANIAIHSFGYGRSHDPASLWLMSNHTSGTYTFIKEWYDLRDCVAGCLGGMMSVALSNVKLHLKIVDSGRFKIRKVAGVGNSVVSSDGRHVDVEMGELRYGEKKEMLVELDLDNSEDLQKIGFLQPSRANRRTMNGTERFMQQMGLDALTLSDPSDMMEGFAVTMIEEVPVFELDGSYFDPAASKQVSRLAHPVLLTVNLAPISNSRPKTPAPASDPIIVRRRMELFSSDMITRALVLISKKQYPQAQKIMYDTRRVLTTTLQNITQGLPPPGVQANTVRNRREQLILQTVRTLQSIMQDIQFLSEALDENVDSFAFDQRNFGAQQAMILRDQKCWTGRTATERLFFTIDNAIELLGRSTDWVNTRE